jgi:hypothetical protein
MLRAKPNQLSFHDNHIWDRVILRITSSGLLNKAVNFFVNELSGIEFEGSLFSGLIKGQPCLNCGQKTNGAMRGSR